MSKNFKRMLALALAVLMMAGLFAVVPTVSAEVTADDILFQMDFTDFEGGVATVQNGDGTTAITTENTFEVAEGRNGKKALVLAGGKSKDANFPAWSAKEYNPFSGNLDAGVTLSTVLNFSSWAQNAYLFFFNPVNADANGGRHITYLKLESGKKITVYVRDGGDTKTFTFRSDLFIPNNWVMLTYVENPADNTISLYANGTKLVHTTASITEDICTAKVADDTPDDTAYYSVGGSKGGPWNDAACAGMLESFTAYGRALTAEEIRGIYDAKDFTNIVENLVSYDTRANTSGESAKTFNNESWTAVPNAQVGTRVYYDRNATYIESLPEYLVGGDMIVSAMSSKSPTGFDGANPFATFTVNKKADVYVVVDARIGDNENPISTLTANDFTKVEGNFKIKNNTANFNKIYKKTFEQGATVSLPAQLDNDSCCYLTFVVAAEEEIVPVEHDFAVTNSDAVVVENGEKYDITWNATVELDEGVELAALNEQATFTEYGVVYGTDADAVAEAIETGENTGTAKIKAFDKIEGEETDVDVYTIFGFRLKGVTADKTRAAQFYVTYTLDGQSYTVYSECVEAEATVAE